MKYYCTCTKTCYIEVEAETEEEAESLVRNMDWGDEPQEIEVNVDAM